MPVGLNTVKAMTRARMGTVELMHFTDEETEAERESKSLLGVSKCFLGGRAAISSPPILKAHAKYNQLYLM